MAYADRWKTVKVDVDDGIAWVELNRPEKRNAMSPTLNAEMVEVLETLDADDDCGVLVLTGAGEAFSAGHGPEGVLPRGRRRPRARPAAGAPRRGAVAVAAAAHLRQADDRDGQRLVLRRRLHASRRLRPRDRRRRGDLRAVRDQLGHSARQRRQQGARRHGRLARGPALRDDRPHLRRPAGGRDGPRQLERPARAAPRRGRVSSRASCSARTRSCCAPRSSATSTAAR